MTIVNLIILLASLIIGLLIGFLTSRQIVKTQLKNIEKTKENILETAKTEAQNYKNAALQIIQEERAKEKLRFENEIASIRSELDKRKESLKEKEQALDQLKLNLTQKENEIGRRERELVTRNKAVQVKVERLDQLINTYNEKLEKLGTFNQEEARKEILTHLEAEARHEAAQMIMEIKEQAKLSAEKEAKEIILRAIQRCAISHATETTVSVINLSSDELKARIIGREGRNIRTFENLTGVEVMIDDTPGVIVVSSFDPIRREVAKLAMEKLVSDGRIHPARIEEVVLKTQNEMEELIKNAGESTVLETEIIGLAPELIRYLGVLKYRTSYGQNLLLHSKEVCYLADLMAQEMGYDSVKARRAGLLHDIGKGADQTFNGPHALIGAEIAERYGEDEIIVNAIAAHHEETELKSPYAFLVAAADSISGARPGARRESFEAYIKRVDNLEAIATSFPGVERAFAIQAGREVRVLVEPERISDTEAQALAVQISQKVKSELKYSGQIKVIVMRETRAISYAT